LAQNDAGLDIIAAGCGGAPFTVMLLTRLFPQLLTATTDTTAVLNGVGIVTLILFPLLGPLITAPEETVHANAVDGLAGAVYVTAWPHTPANRPVILAGLTGTPDVTCWHFAAVTTPHTLVAFTHILPVVKFWPIVTVMLSLVELPVILAGSVHV
jgi:hypothetical protein